MLAKVRFLWLLPWFNLMTSPSLTTGAALSHHIRHFEPVFYDLDRFRNQHQKHRWKRSTFQDPAPPIRMEFKAHKRVFKLQLLPSGENVFAPDVVFDSTRGQIQFDLHRALKGYLDDDPTATVDGVVTSEGFFDGVITVPNEEFYVEPASRYFDEPQNFHSIIYKASDVNFKSASTCASEKLHRTHNTTVVEKMSPKREKSRSAPVGRRRLWKRRSRRQLIDGVERDSNSDLYSVLTNDSSVARSNWTFASNGDMVWREGDALHYKSRLEMTADAAAHNVRSVQRTQWPTGSSQAPAGALDTKKTTCMLYLQADHLFYRKMGSEEACIETMTRHVQKVNSIYRNTDFDQDARVDNISFLIKRIKVHTSDALKDESYRFPGNYGVEKFLELFSEEDYDAFCLAYMFTYRDFEGGTLGLAWTGDLKNAGGVCEKNGHYRGSLKSLNTGIVTLLNYGKHVPPIVSHVTLAHEIGHNFGSPHDPKDDEKCTPGGEPGNYIMFAHATSGDKKNNNRFSPCSLRAINAVLNNKARNQKGCFSEPQDAICGNEVVEPGEECDCGWEDDCTEPCCFPMKANAPPDEIPCRLRPNKVCSPSQGPCCTTECTLKMGDKCREDNGCRGASYCDGKGSRCPLSISKPNKTICNEEFVCFMGECTGSICTAYGLVSCQCKRKLFDSPTKSCELCCQHPNNPASCKSSFEWNEVPYDVPDLYAKPGTPCDDYNGYCDVFQKCREVDPSGPLATLRKLILSTQSMTTLKKWANSHWWGISLFSVMLFPFLVIIVKIFGRRTELPKHIPDNEVAKTVCQPLPVTTRLSGGPVPYRSNQPVAEALAQTATIASALNPAAAITTTHFVKTTISFPNKPCSNSASYLESRGMTPRAPLKRWV